MTTTTSQPSAVIVGAGLMGRWHLDAARHAGGRVTAVVDRDVERAAQLGGTGLACGTLLEALERRPDIVHVCTPPETHTALCQQALAGGCHVIVEKPATVNADDAATLTEVARGAGRLLVPVHQFAFQRGVQQIRERLGRSGGIRHLEVAIASAGVAPDRDALAADIAPHALSLARALLGITVGTLEWRLERPAPGEWRFSAESGRGATVTGLVSLATRPTFATCRVLGEFGSANADLFHGYATFEAAHASRGYKMLRPLATGLDSAGRATANLVRRMITGERAYPGLRALCAATYAATLKSGPPPFADDELVDVARARDILISLARG